MRSHKDKGAGKAGSVVNVMKSKGRLDEKKRRLWVKAEKKVVWGREVELTLTRHNWYWHGTQ